MKNTIKSKSWVLLFLLISAVGIGCFMVLNYHANPLGYFTNEKGLSYSYTDDYGRSIKAKYILDHKDDIEAVVMGGSKAGALNTELLTKYTGLKYYNLYYNMGNFADYLRYTKFLINNTDIQEITIHLSSYEVLAYDRTYRGNAYKVPATLSGNLWTEAKEFLSYLMTDIRTTKNALTKRTKKNPVYADDLTTGMKNRVADINSAKKNHDTFVRKSVTNTLAKHLKTLFLTNTNNEDELDARTKSVEALREIRKLCDDNGITLKLMIGASFLGERYTYECDEYYDYLRQIVEVAGEVWDFSDFCDVNLNPYNFANEKHFNRAVADCMVNIMYGAETKDGFGIVLTPENILPYLQKRRADFKNLRAEYLMNGYVELKGMDDPSYIALEDYGY